MSTHPHRRRDYPGTYAVQDLSSVEELNRLQIQDHMLTASLGRGAL